MEKEKCIRRKLCEKVATGDLPTPPPDPSTTTTTLLLIAMQNDIPEAYRRILGYRERETQFLKTLKHTIEMENIQKFENKPTNEENKCNASITNKSVEEKICTSADVPTNTKSSNAGDVTPIIFSATTDNDQISSNDENVSIPLLHECEAYVMPLLNRTGASIAAALVTEGTIDQLDKLHGLLGQLVAMQEQKYMMRRNTRDVETLIGLVKLQKESPTNPHDFINNEIDEDEFEMNFEYNDSLLETILAAGKSASNKRNSSKRERQRSKSVVNEEINVLQDKDNNKLSMIRRQSAINDIKAKVSKWTKVKAAFKWERANVTSLNECKSMDSGIGLTPLNTEVARYLRVPSVPCTGSSADSVLSSSSGLLLSSGSVPPSPGTISSSSSIEDIGGLSEDIRNNRDSSKSESRSESRTQDDDARRSRSLDGDVTIAASSFSRQLDKQNKNKTPWRKVKDIIQHRGSLKGKSRSRSVKSANSVGCSRDASPCDSVDNGTSHNFETNTDRADSGSSNQTSPITKTNPTVTVSTPFGINTGSISLQQVGNTTLSTPTSSKWDGDDTQLEQIAYTSSCISRGSRKTKPVYGIGCLPEGVQVDLKSTEDSTTSGSSNHRGKPPIIPLNLNLRQDSSDAEFGYIMESSSSPILQHKNSKWSKVKKSFLTGGNSSAPNSPSRQFEFFGEFESEDLSSGDFSEPSTPYKRVSAKSNLLAQQDEIKRRYMELQQQISLEFKAKQKEWERIRSASLAVSSPVPTTLHKDENNKDTMTTAKPIEENLTPDFKKKLQEWRIKKQQSMTGPQMVKDAQTSPTKETDNKKIDWNLWKTGQLKLQGQGLKPLPDEKDLPEDFLKKLDEWKKMKATGSVPAYIAQTSTMTSTDDTVKRQSLKSSQLPKHDVNKKLKGSEELEKELHRIERERQRLERERLKCLEREKGEKLSKLKSMVPESPVKEVVVQTSKGVLKFEGISRKFTRKLYEWEKARGIGPESSTFALLHPGYRPLVVGNGEGDDNDDDDGEDKGAMQRSFSMNSMSPNPSMPSISHQPSSLSLNDVDDLKETSSVNDRRISSNPELEIDKVQSIQDGPDEPEAVIVEVEDDYIETAAPLLTVTPRVEQQTPVYKYEQPRKEICAGKKEHVLVGGSTVVIDNSISKLFKETIKMISTYLDEECTKSDENLLGIKSILKSLIEALPTLQLNFKKSTPKLMESIDNIKEISLETARMIAIILNEQHEEFEKKYLISGIDTKLFILRKSINFISKHIEYSEIRSNDVPEISITSDENEKNVATVSVTPRICHGEVVINKVEVMDSRDINDNRNRMDPKLFTTNENRKKLSANEVNPTGTNLTEQDFIRITRNLSIGSGAKRKTKLRRLGSRQSSKTESDSDNDTPNIILEAPRRVKRKTSRAKKLLDIEKDNVTTVRATTPPTPPSLSTEQMHGLTSSTSAVSSMSVKDDVVYVLKIKPNKQYQRETLDEENQQESHSENILLSPTQTCIELIDRLHKNTKTSNDVAPSVFVKTKRKMFTPVDNCLSSNSTIISTDVTVQSKSFSDKNDNLEIIDKCIKEDDNTDIKYSNTPIKILPPLPHQQLSNVLSSKFESPKLSLPKEPSPVIRMLIAKYNQRLSVDRRNSSSHSSGSCSPVLERRIKTRTEEYLGNVVKSSSAGNVIKYTKLVQHNFPVDDDADNAINGNIKDNFKIKRILKSSSAGILPNNWIRQQNAKHSASQTSINQHVTTNLHIQPNNENECDDNDDVFIAPLAADSLRNINVKKSRDDSSIDLKTEYPIKIEGVFRKRMFDTNYDNSVKLKTGTIRKLKTKLDEDFCFDDGTTCHNNYSLVKHLSEILPDKSANTIPKITRKYETKPPTKPISLLMDSINYNLMESLTPPSTPVVDYDELSITNHFIRPQSIITTTATIISDRARKLKLAKDAFLKSSIRSYSESENTNEDKWKNRLSQLSTAGSESSSDGHKITKSASVGMIDASETQKQTQQNTSGYVSLPRNVLRNDTLNNTGSTGDVRPDIDGFNDHASHSKFVFANITSKFRKVKLRKSSSKNNKNIPKMNAVSVLCRQSLMVDISKTNPTLNVTATNININHNSMKLQNRKIQTEQLKKSGSVQAMGGFGTLLFRRHERADKIKKCKSIGQLEDDVSQNS